MPGLLRKGVLPSTGSPLYLSLNETVSIHTSDQEGPGGQRTPPVPRTPKPSNVSEEHAPDPKFCPGLASQLQAATFWTQRLDCSIWDGGEGGRRRFTCEGVGPLQQMK